jgi:SAM-dependent methyltransferase
MTPGLAATWIAPADEVDRGNLLGAAGLVAQRQGRELGVIAEGAEQLEAALGAARDVGMLILPEPGQVLPGAEDELAMLRRARGEGWRLFLLSFGADSARESGELAERALERLVATTPTSRSVPMPPVSLRHRVSAGGEDAFSRSGLMHVECFSSCLEAAGASLGDASDLLDWGAGCGRMTAHLIDRAREARVVAADTDGDAIAWVEGNLAVDAAHVLPLLPPSGLESDAFDLIVGHSVFSHLGVDAQDRWLQELARVARPGAHVAVSFNGPIALRWHLENPLIEMPASVESDLSSDGIAIWDGDGWEAVFYEGYHTTFHRHDYLEAHWARWLELIAIHEAAAPPSQDIAVLRAR